MNDNSYLQALQAIDWSKQAGAYSATFPLAEHLRDVQSQDIDTVFQALDNVLGHVCHQDVLERSAETVAPLLLQAARHEHTRYPWPLLEAFLRLLQAAWTYPRKFGFLPRRFPPSAGQPQPTGASFVSALEYNRISDRIHATLSEHRLSLSELVSHPVPQTRAYACRLIALLDEPGEEVLRRLQERLEHEDDEAVASGLLLALALGASKQERSTVQRLAADAMRAPEALRRAAGGVASLLVDSEGTLYGREEVLLEALSFQERDSLRFPWCDGSLPGLVAEALLYTGVHEERASELLFTALESWTALPHEELEFHDWNHQDLIAERIIDIAFREHWGRSEYLTRHELRPLQKSVVERFRKYPPPLIGIFSPQAHGIRDLWADAPRLLGVESGALDRECRASWGGRWVLWPLWKWAHQAALTDRLSGNLPAQAAQHYVLDMLMRELGPEEAFEAAMEAVSGVYAVPQTLFIHLVASRAGAVKAQLQELAAALSRTPSAGAIALLVIATLELARSEQVPWLESIRPHIDRIEDPALRAMALQRAQALA